MIAPPRGQRRERIQDGRPLRRYRGRWQVERLFAWLHHFRRLVIPWEYHAENFFCMVRLGLPANPAATPVIQQNEPKVNQQISSPLVASEFQA